MAQVRTNWSTTLVAIGVGLYFLRDILTPFAMAVILWFVIDSLAHAFDMHLRLPHRLSRPLAILFVTGCAVLIALVVIGNIATFALRAGHYPARLDALLAQGYAQTGLPGAAPTFHQVFSQIDLRGLLAPLADAARGLTADAILTLVFVIFMFSAAGGASKKLDIVFSVPAEREWARQVITAIQQYIRSYLLVQTIASFATSALTFVTLWALGLNNALYWSVLVFLLNFIPVLGPVIAILLPTVFASMQFTNLGSVAAIALGVGIWPFLFGNFILPRLTGRSLNLSPLVVLLALAFWGTLWGVVGAFLATPLSVMIMIVLAQFPATRAIAIFMSGDGQPLQFASPPLGLRA